MADTFGDPYGINEVHKFNLPAVAADASTRDASSQLADEHEAFEVPQRSVADDLMASATSPGGAAEDAFLPSGSGQEASSSLALFVTQQQPSASSSGRQDTPSHHKEIQQSPEVPPIRLRTMQRAQQEFERIVQERPSSGSRRSWAGALTSRVLFETRQGEPPTPRAPQNRPLCTMTLAQQLESNYDELWVRTTVHRDKTKLRLFYIVPGNPGTTKAYSMFAKLLSLKFTADVCVISHLGHCSFSNALYSFDSQVLHHQRILRKHCREYSTVTILGHSIGGYLSLLLADSSDDVASKIDSLGLLMPTVSRFSRTPYHLIALMTAPLVQLVVRFLFASLPGVVSAISKAPRSLLEEVQGGKFFHNVLYMARDELRKLSKDVPRDLLWRWGAEKKKLFVIYADQDQYTSRDVQQQVRYCAEPHSRKASSVCSLKSLSHSFCLNPQETAVVVELVSDFLQFGGFDSTTLIQASETVRRGWLWRATSAFGSAIVWPLRLIFRPFRIVYPAPAGNR